MKSKSNPFFTAPLDGNILEKVFPVCVGPSRLSKKWTNTTMSWEELAERTAQTTRTAETVAEYMALSRDEQAQIKDIGGIVCGSLKHDKTSSDKQLAGRKTKENILSRSILTFDLDECPAGFDPKRLIEEKLPGVAAIGYTTHKHTPEAPRWRVFIPLSEWVSPFYYEGIARYIGSLLGMQLLDKTTFQYNRLMYWPSTSKDGKFEHFSLEGLPISQRNLVKDHPELKRESSWPRHPDEEPVQRTKEEIEGQYANKVVSDPLTKDRKIGAFCRAYPIEEAIAVFLSDVYTPHGCGRYTYVNGSSTKGLVIYEGQFAYSNHATDPANTGHDLNAFDLVRIHKFGYKDAGVPKNTPPQKLPSFKAMCQLVIGDPRAGEIYRQEKQEKAASDFEGIDDATETDNTWREKLQRNKMGVKTTPYNLRLIALNDEKIKKIKFNEFDCYDYSFDKDFYGYNGQLVTDEGTMKIAGYLCEEYDGSFSQQHVDNMLMGTRRERGFNPVQDYILSQKWDGVPRCEELLIKYLGAPDDALTRAISKKWLTAAVRRAFQPGTKFDNMLVLVGAQGCGKSTLLRTLAKDGEFSDDSLSFDMDEKQLTEHASAAWVLEFAELTGLQYQSGENRAKSYLSSPSDKHRAAYGRRSEKHPRVCVFAGTTNETHFLNDLSSRKFWVVDCSGNGGPSVWGDELREAVPQIWAEAYSYHIAGYPIYLEEVLEVEAREMQLAHNIDAENPVLGALQQFLDTPIPRDWEKQDKLYRHNYFFLPGELHPRGDIYRNVISVAALRNEFPEAMLVKDDRKLGKLLAMCRDWKRDKKRETGEIYGRQYHYRRICPKTEVVTDGFDDETDEQL